VEGVGSSQRGELIKARIYVSKARRAEVLLDQRENGGKCWSSRRGATDNGKISSGTIPEADATGGL
jgi:hypothetical protein